MRCSCCNTMLTPRESSRRFVDTMEFTDTCTKCLKDVPRQTREGVAFRGQTPKEYEEELDHLVDDYLEYPEDENLWDERDE